MHENTKRNLLNALKGESFAHVKYMFFAERARNEGEEETAKLFEAIADEERMEHFRELSALYGLIGETPDNILNAIQGESDEVTSIYVTYEEEARAAGDIAAADRFEEIRNDEMRHEARFKEALSRERLLALD